MTRSLLLLLISLSFSLSPAGWDVERVREKMAESEITPPLATPPPASRTVSQAVEFVDQKVPPHLDFSLTHFKAPLNFNSATFTAPAAFRWSLFEEQCTFSHTRFEGSVDFYSSIFREEANFFSADFLGPYALFQASQFEGGANFTRSIFDQKGSFVGAQFLETSSFDYATFYKVADFHGAKFEGEITFYQTLFHAELNLSDATFLGPVSFREATLPDLLDLSDIHEISGTLDFRGARSPTSGSSVRVNLLGTDLAKVALPYDMVELYFPAGTPEREIRIVYEELLHRLQSEGYKEAHQRLAIDFKQHQYRESGRWFANFLDHYWWNYGFNKGRIFLWIGIFVLILTCINAAIYEKLVEHSFSMSFFKKEPRDEVTRRNPVIKWFYFWPLALVYTMVVFFGGFFRIMIGMMRGESRATNLNTYIIFIIILGAVCLFFVLEYIL